MREEWRVGRHPDRACTSLWCPRKRQDSGLYGTDRPGDPAGQNEAIVLIPEIALTYQTVRRFYGRFGDKVSVINSRLSQGERYDQFKRARAGGTPGHG